MKTISFLLALFFLLSVSAIAKPPHQKHMKAKRAYVHSYSGSAGRNAKVRKQRTPAEPMFDFAARNPSAFSTVKAPKPYRYRNGF